MTSIRWIIVFFLSQVSSVPAAENLFPKYFQPVTGRAANPNQLSLVITSPAPLLEQINIKFYKNNNCTNFSGKVTLIDESLTAGTYTSSDASNFALCSKYSARASGCQDNIDNVQSLRFLYVADNGAAGGNCISAGGRQFLSNDVGGLCNSGSCGFQSPQQDEISDCANILVQNDCTAVPTCFWSGGLCRYNALGYRTCYEVPDEVDCLNSPIGCQWWGFCIPDDF